MNHEQSMDEILKLLKKSFVEDADPSMDSSEEALTSAPYGLSNEDVHAELKKRYGAYSDQPKSASVLLMEEESKESEGVEIASDEEIPEEGDPSDEQDELLLRELQDYETAEELSMEALPNVSLEAPLALETEPLEAEREPEPLEEELRPAVMELLLQLGCEEEWEEFSYAEPLEEEMPMQDEPKEDPVAPWRALYKKSNQKLWIEGLRVVGLSLISVILFLYDALFFGFLDGAGGLVRSYPSAYTLFGVQILLLGAVLIGPRLLRGLSQLIHLQVNLYSVSALMVFFSILYDLIFVAASFSAPPTPFRFLASLFMVMAALGSFWDAKRRMDYLTLGNPQWEEARFTLVSDPDRDPVVQTMYRGGLSADKTVYSPRTLAEKESVSEGKENNENASFGLSQLLVPVVLGSLLSVLLSVWLGQRVENALSAALSFLMITVPISALFVPRLVTYVSMKRLRRREICFQDERAVEAYGKTDYLVFKDLHLFSKINPKDVGMVAFEKDQVGDLLGCLRCLYKTIGGPMIDVFDNVPREYQKAAIRIRRIKRNGIESIVDRKHVLLIGDADFMRQYGLIFDEGDQKRGRGLLCVSLDGRKTAKLRLPYRMEPLFEMLVERLYEEKVQCVIETFDPLIQASFVASSRRLGNAPINVIHKGCAQLKAGEDAPLRPLAGDSPSMIVGASRLKLAEAIIWCKRLRRIKRTCTVAGYASSVLGLGIFLIALFLGVISEVNQYWVLFWLTLSSLCSCLLAMCKLPGTEDLTVEKYLRERQRKKTRKKKEAR